ncbi:HAD family hydrolase [Curtobacterium sp. VKM Ac-2852]|uniref:HAD family hydrolase n=1 Tax=Curtobacterium sp. VKM Ac-2852 TaxID=2739024 RepID=UPI00156578AE|nr:HAD family hydrolase [Curtobacterium sp. VKM Ac-2852]
MPTPRAICFDLDGTLFDHRGSARVGVTRFLQGLGVEVTEAAIGAWFTAEDEQFERWRSGVIGFQDQRRARLRTVLPQLGVAVPGNDAGLDAVFDDYLRAYREAWRLFPESLALLHELRDLGHCLGLLTNGTETQQLDKLARTGLADAFDVVCISERIGFQKPDVRAFHALTAQLDVDPADCLFVGDDPERDVAGARAAGMRAVLVDHAQPEAPGLRALVLSAL